MGWQCSRFTTSFDGRDGDLIVCNSFMGAVLRIPASERTPVERALRQGITVEESGRPPFDELIRSGVFVTEADFLDDVEKVVLDTEREESGFGLIILPHENCNFRCVYCYESFERGRMGDDTVAAVKAFVAANAGDWRHFGVGWFGGEPLLARDVILGLSDAFMATCAEAGIPYRSSITTNGYFLRPKVVDELLARRVGHYQVTLDGPADEHDARRHLARGGPTYDRIFANLVAMHERDDPFDVTVRVNFDEQSLGSLERFLDGFAAFAGDDRFTFSFFPIGRWGGPRDRDLPVCGEEQATLARLALLDRAGKMGFSHRSIEGALTPGGATCYAGRTSSLVVGSDGTLYKCTVAFEDPRNHVGVLLPDGRLQLDETKWRAWTGLEGKAAGKCDSCWYHGACQSRACPLIALQADDGEPPCPSTKAEVRRLAELYVYGDIDVPPLPTTPPRKLIPVTAV